jgi:ribonuclease HI
MDGWFASGKRLSRVKNLDLWNVFRKVKRLYSKSIELRWVPAHSGNILNERAHTLCWTISGQE